MKDTFDITKDNVSQKIVLFNFGNMDSKQIGKDAGVVWQILDASKNRSCTYEELKLRCGLSENALNRALGWLAREDKLEFDDTQHLISLPHFSFF